MSERADRERPIAHRVAISLVAAFVVLVAARLVLAVTMGLSNEYTGSSARLSDVVFGLVAIVGTASLFIAVGWAIVTRQPRNTIGWLLLAIPLTAVLSLFVGDYATEALTTHPGSLPASRPPGSIDGSSS
jgi:hypothetical protein